MTHAWVSGSNYLVVVSVANEEALETLAQRCGEEGVIVTRVREPDLGNEMTAVAIQPGDTARRLCANLPLALREMVVT